MCFGIMLTNPDGTLQLANSASAKTLNIIYRWLDIPATGYAQLTRNEGFASLKPSKQIVVLSVGLNVPLDSVVNSRKG